MLSLSVMVSTHFYHCSLYGVYQSSEGVYEISGIVRFCYWGGEEREKEQTGDKRSRGKYSSMFREVLCG